jgi:hypothetical protein
LRYPNEDDRIPYLPPSSKVIGDIVFPLFMLKLENRNVVSLGLCFHRLAETFRDLTEHHR